MSSIADFLSTYFLNKFRLVEVISLAQILTLSFGPNVWARFISRETFISNSHRFQLCNLLDVCKFFLGVALFLDIVQKTILCC